MVIRKPGFDGEYGVIPVFEEGEVSRVAGQGSVRRAGAVLNCGSRFSSIQ